MTIQKRTCLVLLVVGLPIALSNYATAATGTETYTYDARGRLASVTYPNGTSINYAYDAAGNRTSSGAAAGGGGGTFAFVSGTHSALGSAGDNASATIKNTGTAAITNITYTCTGQSFHTYGNPPTSIAAGAQAVYVCQAAGSGAYSVTLSISGTGASNSPFTQSF